MLRECALENPAFAALYRVWLDRGSGAAAAHRAKGGSSQQSTPPMPWTLSRKSRRVTQAEAPVAASPRHQPMPMPASMQPSTVRISPPRSVVFSFFGFCAFFVCAI